MLKSLCCESSPALLVALLLTLVCCGCGPSKAEQEQLAGIQQAVETSLGAWKRGEKPETLLKAAQAIEFFDEDWNQSVGLVAYTVQQTYFETDGTPRCAVALVLKDGDQQPTEIRVTYEMISKEDRLVIARDPMS